MHWEEVARKCRGSCERVVREPSLLVPLYTQVVRGTSSADEVLRHTLMLVLHLSRAPVSNLQPMPETAVAKSQPSLEASRVWQLAYIPSEGRVVDEDVCLGVLAGPLLNAGCRQHRVKPRRLTRRFDQG
jgi:hypothetical protein